MIADIEQFIRDVRGATLTEYAMILGCLAITAITGLTLFGHALSDFFTNEVAKFLQ